MLIECHTPVLNECFTLLIQLEILNDNILLFKFVSLIFIFEFGFGVILKKLHTNLRGQGRTTEKIKTIGPKMQKTGVRIIIYIIYCSI